jgi:hypothetical protein
MAEIAEFDHDSPWHRMRELLASHPKLVSALEREYKNMAELLEAARKGAQLGPIIGAQTIVEQEHELKSLRAQLAARDSDVQELLKQSGATVETCAGLARMITQLRQTLAFVRYAFAEHVCKNRHHESGCFGYYEAHCINALMDTGGVIASDVLLVEKAP